MAAKQKFLFDKDFDEDVGFERAPAFEAAPAGDAASAPEPEPEPEPAPPGISEAELAAAREEAYQAGLAEGREAGRAEAREAAEQASADALAKVADGLNALGEELRAAAESRSRDSLEVALRLVAKLFPALDRRHGLQEAEALIAHCLDRLREEPRVVVRVADTLLDPLRARIDELAAQHGFAGRVVLLADEDLPRCDVRVEWADGGAERDTERLWREIEDAAARTLGASGTAGPGGPDRETTTNATQTAGDDRAPEQTAPAGKPVHATA